MVLFSRGDSVSNTYKLHYILLKEISFSQGKWQGNFDFVFSSENGFQYTGTVPFMYDRTWHLFAFKYSIHLEESSRINLKENFFLKFEALSSSLEELIITPRELYGEKPIMSSFEINEANSDRDNIEADFSLKNNKETFKIVVKLTNNMWVYEIIPNKENIDFYKTFYKWEDAVFTEVIKEIESHHKYRMKFALHLKKFKYK